MTQNKFITAAISASRERGVTCTVPNTYLESHEPTSKIRMVHMHIGALLQDM